MAPPFSSPKEVPMTKAFGWIGNIGALLMALGFFSALLNLVGLEFKA